MKLVQRIIIKYYVLKLKLIELFSLSKAAKAAFELFCTPYSRRRTYSMPKVFEKAVPLTFQLRHDTIQGFRWNPTNANGKKLLICHGFDSLSYKYAYFIEPLLEAGFEVLAFDAPAHGKSSGKTINALLYRDMILKVNQDFGALNIIMAHSFGCIAACLAVEHAPLPLAKLILIAPATETTRSITDFARYLQISDRLKKAMEALILEIGGQPPSWYSIARIVRTTPVKTLWLHDKEDPITPYEDMQYLIELKLPYVDFVITSGLGHSLYRKKEIADKIIDWIKQ